MNSIKRSVNLPVKEAPHTSHSRLALASLFRLSSKLPQSLQKSRDWMANAPIGETLSPERAAAMSGDETM